MDGISSASASPPSTPSVQSDPASKSPAAEPAAPAARAEPAAPATPKAAEDGFGATPQEENASKFAQRNGPDGPPAAAPAGAPDANAVREHLGTAFDGVTDNVPGLSAEARGQMRQELLKSADGAAERLGVPLTALKKADVSFDINGSIVNGSLSGTFFPKAGDFDASVGVSTPSVPGVAASVNLTFQVADGGINPEGTPGLSGVASADGFTIKAGSDGTVTVGRELVSLGGGEAPKVGLELNIPINETLRKISRTTETDLKREAVKMGTGEMGLSEAEYSARQADINRKYDALMQGAKTPEQRDLLDQERGRQLLDLQKSQIQMDQLLQDIDRQRLQRIEAR